MSSLVEVQRIIGLSLNKIQMGRNQRGGLPLHKNLLVATVLNKARDVYMQETMYMNYRLMACGQFAQEGNEDLEEEEDTPEAEDYEEDSESDVEDDSDNAAKKDYASESLQVQTCIAAAGVNVNVTASQQLHPNPFECNQLLDHHSAGAASDASSALEGPSTVPTSAINLITTSTTTTSNTNNGNNSANTNTNNDEGFIDESDCDCDTRNFCQDSESRVPFQYCFNCAPFHPSNGRGPTLVSPQSSSAACMLPQQPVTQEQEDKLIYDMDSKSTRNQSGQQSIMKRKRHISLEETEDAITSILPKKMKECSDSEETQDLNDSGFQEETEMFHPAFRGHTPNNGMEVEQITSLVSIFSFGQQLLNSSDCSSPVQSTNCAPTQPPPSSTAGKKDKDEEDSDSDSDTSSDSGHSSDDQINSDDNKAEEGSENLSLPGLASIVNSCSNSNNISCCARDSDISSPELRCSSQLKDAAESIDVSAVSVAAVV